MKELRRIGKIPEKANKGKTKKKRNQDLKGKLILKDEFLQEKGYAKKPEKYKDYRCKNVAKRAQ